MRKLYWAVAGVVLVGVSLGLMLPAFHGGVEPTVPDEAKHLASRLNAFAIELYKELARQPGNILVSPYSVGNALALAWAGAEGETAQQMAQALHFKDMSPEQVHTAVQALNQHLQRFTDRRGSEFYLANAAWLLSDYHFSPKYLQQVRHYYRAELREVDFRSKDTPQAINRWFAEQTRGRITHLVAEGDLAGEAPLVLTNAVYFAGLWQFPFDKSATVTAPFHVSDSKQVKVPMMQQTNFFAYTYQENLFQMVILPYRDGRASLCIILATQGQPLDALERQLSVETLQEWLSSAEKAHLQLALPRFEVRCHLQLESTLVRLGMRDAFSPDRADFRGISSDGRLYLERVLHQAWLEINESGTQAGAGTLIRAKSVLRPFTVNRPFLIVLRDEASGLILFLGRIVNPLGNA